MSGYDFEDDDPGNYMTVDDYAFDDGVGDLDDDIDDDLDDDIDFQDDPLLEEDEFGNLYGAPGVDTDVGMVYYPEKSVGDLATMVDANSGDPQYGSRRLLVSPNSIHVPTESEIDALAQQPLTARESARLVSTRHRNLVLAAPPTNQRAKSPPVRIQRGKPSDTRLTINRMTDYELASLLGERAQHIEDGATDIDPRVIAECRRRGIDDALNIAMVELYSKNVPLPMKVRQCSDRNKMIEWDARDLVLPTEVTTSTIDPELRKYISPEIPNTLDHLYMQFGITKFAYYKRT